MVIRTLAMAGGLAGAVALSQFPEFSQQYLQRLSGALDELRPIVVAFEATAAAQDMTPEEALVQIGGTPVADSLRQTMETSIVRYRVLDAAHASLSAASPLERLARPWAFRDTDLVQRTWDDFRPAVPVTPDGLIAAGIGFAAGFLAVAFVLGALRRILFGRAALA